MARVIACRCGVERFERWYNGQHLHSAISFATPEQRHRGAEIVVLERRGRFYA